MKKFLIRHKKGIKVSGIILLIILILIGSTVAISKLRNTAPNRGTGGNREITVDANKRNGDFNSKLFGYYLDPGIKSSNRSDSYRQLGVSSVRTHDAGVDSGRTALADVFGGKNAIFSNIKADPNNPKSYNWGPTDKMIKNILNTQATVYFRYGNSVKNNLTIPKSAKKYQKFLELNRTVTKRIIEHYNLGDTGGFNHALTYFEVWNEPDLGMFWKGTTKQYLQLYNVVSTTAKQTDSQLLVGGPTDASANNIKGTEDTFLKYVKKHNLPLDFYSFHWYTGYFDPYDFNEYGTHMRKLLNKYGYTKTPIYMTEWNYMAASIGRLMFGPLDANHYAAFVADSLIYMQDSDIDAAYKYMPIMSNDGKLTEAGEAFKDVSQISRTGTRLRVTGADNKGFAVLAGKNTSQVKVVISNYQRAVANTKKVKEKVLSVPFVGAHFTILKRNRIKYSNNSGYNLTIKGLTKKKIVMVKRYRIDRHHDDSLISNKKIRVNNHGELKISQTLQPGSVEKIVINK